ncbi:MAG: Hpt domain-containing protein [Alphaproteobacteria bacterium]|jgi:HPt (histidine-containing phosphotransfer) domain-containing protein|nr:Hpt domain-containing protein [Alphaproteobacteria bacterium]MDP6813014.1 Hpt domain-containing protein [Alphaproteobacteria bacterium]
MPRARPPIDNTPPGKPGDCEVIEIPNKLAAKVGPGQGIDRAALERAEAVVEQVKASYDGRLESELEELLDEFETMQAEGRLDLDQLHDRVHEIRGEAGTFGYPLVSEIGRLLCELLAPMDQVGEAEKQAIETHLRAIQTVVTRKVKGTGPDVAKQIVEGLRVMAEKTLA